MLFFFLNGTIHICKIIMTKHKKKTILSSMSSIPINDNGAQRKWKSCGSFTRRNLMLVMFILHDLCFLLGTWTEEISKTTAVKICWGQVSYSRVTPPPPFHHLSLTASPLPLRQGKTRPVVVHSLDRHPCWPRSSNFRLHVNCARKPSTAVIQGHHSFCYFSNRS